MQTTAIDLRLFCAGEDDLRAYLRTPFIDGGKTIATNGHLLVSLDHVVDGVGPADKQMAGKAAALIATTAGLTASYAIDVTTLPTDKCSTCKGSGCLSQDRCDECDGNGEFANGSHWYSCKECDGRGLFFVAAEKGGAKTEGCTDCKGTGFATTSVVFGEAGFDSNYLRRIASLPCVQLLPGSSTGVARFDFEGGVGIIMPRRG